MSTEKTPSFNRYNSAEAMTWGLCFILLVLHVGNVSSIKTQLVVIEVTRSQASILLSLILIGCNLWMYFEKRLSMPCITGLTFSAVRSWVAHLVSIYMLAASYRFMTEGTAYQGFPIMYPAAFVALWLGIGFFSTHIAEVSFCILSKPRAEQLNMPRIPFAIKAQYLSFIPVILCYSVYHYLIMRCPFVPYLWVWGSVTYFLVWAVFIADALIDGEMFPQHSFWERISALRRIFLHHEYLITMINQPLPSELSGKLAPADAFERTKQCAAEQGLQNLAGNVRVWPESGNFSLSVDNKTAMVSIICDKEKGAAFKVRLRYYNQLVNVELPYHEIEAMINARLASSNIDIISEPALGAAVSNSIMATSILLARQQLRPLYLGRLIIAGEIVLVEKMVGLGDVNVNEMDEAGWFPLLAATAQGCEGLVKILLDMGANPDTENVNGLSPLIIAARYNLTGIMKILLLAGANINYRNVRGETALHAACQHGSTDAVNLLIQEQADVLIKNYCGMMALDIAQALGHGVIAARLRHRGNK